MRAFWASRRVLVTGHTGFKGSWLALWLSELGAKVTGVGLEPDTEPNLFGQLELARRLERHHIADIREPQALAEIVEACQPEVVLHLAAQPLVLRSYADPLGTWATNVQGSLHLLEALKPLQHPCAVVMVTTDKVYENQEWNYGYRENDRLGGHDPYSASKAAAELAIACWRSSFCGTAPHQTPYLRIATARAGNVIGGGDWAADRIVPDAMRALAARQPIPVRNPAATRPWQHVICAWLRSWLPSAIHPARHSTSAPAWQATVRWESWWARSSSTGRGSGWIRATPMLPMKPACCICRSTRPITAWAGNPAGITPPRSRAPSLGTGPITTVQQRWSAASRI
jgi:CDP-glucose 4,6-dehydratase